jgi:hypothetical protein
VNLANIGFVVKAEASSGDVERNALGHTQHVSVKGAAHVLDIAEYECLLRVKANGDDVPSVAARVSLYCFDGTIFAAK